MSYVYTVHSDGVQMCSAICDIDYLFELVVHSTRKVDKRKYLSELVGKFGEVVGSLRNEVNTYKNALRYVHGYTISGNGELCKLCSTINNNVPSFVNVYIYTIHHTSIAYTCVVVQEWKAIYRYSALAQTHYLGELQALVDCISMLPKYVSINTVYTPSTYLCSACSNVGNHTWYGPDTDKYEKVLEALRSSTNGVAVMVPLDDSIMSICRKYVNRPALDQSDVVAGWYIQSL